MKKTLSKLIYLLFLTVLIVIFISFPAYAISSSPSLGINNYLVDAEVMKDGSLAVSENVTFHFSGRFNGFTKQIVFSKSSGLSSLKVVELSGNVQRLYNPVSTAVNGNIGVYTIDKSSKDSWTLKIFSPSSDESKTFLIYYILGDVVTKYNDIAELNWNFIGKDNQTAMKEVQINIKVPDGSKNEELKVFAHGPLNGISKIIDSKTLSLHVSSLPSKTFVEARVLFPTILLPASSKIVNEDALNRILTEEKEFADAANAKRARSRTIVSLINILAFVLILGTAILAYFLHIKYNKEPKPNFEGKYYRDLPEDCTPAVMSVLYNFGDITTKDITSTLMDLVRKKYLKIDVNIIEVRKILGKRKEEIYTILKLKDADSELTEQEKYFFNWMINDIGNGQELTFDNIKQYTKSKPNAIKFKSSYDAWSNIVKMQAEDKKVFDRSISVGKWIGSIAGIVDLAVGIIMIVMQGYIGFAVILSGILVVVFSVTFKRRTVYGATQFEMWRAFRRFLKEFSNLKEAEIPSLIIWEHYLVYAVSLGVAKEVIKQLKVVIPEENYRMDGLTYLYIGNYIHGFGAFEHFDNISSTFEQTANSAFTLANSSDSSSSGGGGGFSSGSSGGGGGGGFGGF